MDDLGVPLFLETPKSIQLSWTFTIAGYIITAQQE